ncbi:hypothetical protein GCM10010495_68560 [Kitasatospora herbaricolor]|nr:hypothetical protein GCM10010495_68560 [Kitasatospora herbaricolor]
MHLLSGLAERERQGQARVDVEPAAGAGDQDPVGGQEVGEQLGLEEGGHRPDDSNAAATRAVGLSWAGARIRA